MPQCLAAGLCALLAIKPLRPGWPWRLVVYTSLLALFSSSSYYLAMNYGLLTPRLLVYVIVNYLLFRTVFGLEKSSAQMAALISTAATVATTMAGTVVSMIAGVAFAEYFTMVNSLEAAFIWYPCWFGLPLLLWKWRETLSRGTWEWINLLQQYRKARVLLWMLMVQMSIMTGGLMNIASALAQSMQPLRLGVTMVTFSVVFFATLLFCYLSLQMARELYRRSIENCLLDQTVELLSTVESQRAGFQNALQELDALAVKDWNNELGIYLDQINQDLKQVNMRLMAGNTMISALLNAKLVQSEQSGVNLEIDLEAPLSGAVVELHTLEIIRIMGNLLDNALDAVENLGTPLKWVRVNTRHIGPLQCLKVANPLPPDATISEEIFDPGFTGKGASHSGLGLHIARSLARQLGGQLHFEIEPGPVLSFTLVLPR